MISQEIDKQANLSPSQKTWCSVLVSIVTFSDTVQWRYDTTVCFGWPAVVRVVGWCLFLGADRIIEIIKILMI